jgi:hypothetical protein
MLHMHFKKQGSYNNHMHLKKKQKSHDNHNKSPS